MVAVCWALCAVCCVRCCVLCTVTCRLSAVGCGFVLFVYWLFLGASQLCTSLLSPLPALHPGHSCSKVNIVNFTACASFATCGGRRKDSLTAEQATWKVSVMLHCEPSARRGVSFCSGRSLGGAVCAPHPHAPPTPMHYHPLLPLCRWCQCYKEKPVTLPVSVKVEVSEGRATVGLDVTACV